VTSTRHALHVPGAALLAVASLGLLAGCAAPPPTGSATTTVSAPVAVEELGKGEQTGAVDVEVSGPAQVVFRRITIKPGAGTGLHCHAGQLVAVVEQGELTHYAPTYPGGVHVYGAGDSVVEGARYVHEGKNLGTQDLVLLVTYVIAEGQPLAQTDLSRCDPIGTV
jgi:quercetin dioxygenase-like cupin family protein